MALSPHPIVAGSRRPLSALALAGVLCLGLAGCSGGSPPSASTHSSQVGTASVGSLGTVLVTGGGYTLYLFEPDHQSTSTCSGPCAAAWPPDVLPAGTSSATASGGARASLLGTVRRSDGKVQVTYDHWPLYRWVGDTRPGVATGESLDQFGGFWYALSPTGVAVKS